MSAGERAWTPCEDNDDPCMSVDMSGPRRASHILCRRPKGHDGPHMNELYEWAQMVKWEDSDEQ